MQCNLSLKFYIFKSVLEIQASTKAVSSFVSLKNVYTCFLCTCHNCTISHFRAHTGPKFPAYISIPKLYVSA